MERNCLKSIITFIFCLLIFPTNTYSKGTIKSYWNHLKNEVFFSVDEIFNRNKERNDYYSADEPSVCIVSFVDDDSGQYVPDIWGPIIDSTGIKMGFACITGYMGGGIDDTIPDVFRQFSIKYLKKLYEDGHDVYSHSWNHHEFNKEETTLEDLDFQCRASKKWMIDNGFDRNINIIVAPGGIGQRHIEKKDVIRKYYEYAVEAGHGINPEPLDNWCIYRVNADTESLDSLMHAVDIAKEEKALLVFMNHAYELNKDKGNQSHKIISLIRYIQSCNIDIMPLSKALEYKGNIIAKGEYLYNNSIFVSKSGRIKYDEKSNTGLLLFSLIILLVIGFGIYIKTRK